MKQSFPSPLVVIEASSSAGSVALFVDGALVGDREISMGPSREDAILPAVAALLTEAGVSPKNVRAIACGSGPGSFTSLRIAASLAKGFVVANNAQLYAIPSMLLAVAALTHKPGEYVLHSDALRGERYVVRATVNGDGSIVMSSTARMSVPEAMALAGETHSALVCVGATVTGDHDTVALQPHARNAEHLHALWQTFGPVRIESWEPDYGRLAEAQVKWETAHGRVLPTG